MTTAQVATPSAVATIRPSSSSRACVVRVACADGSTTRPTTASGTESRNSPLVSRSFGSSTPPASRSTVRAA